MKKMEPASNRSAQNPESFHRSVDSASPAQAGSATAYFPRLPQISRLDQAFPTLRDEDLAHWGAYSIEDLGIIELDKVVGSPKAFGAMIRAEMAPTGPLNDKWAEIASRILRWSPGATNPTALLSTMCQLCAAQLFVEGRVNASA